MPTVKTAISLPEPLFTRAKEAANRLEISPSQLVARAVEEFLKRYESRKLLDSLNRAYEDSPSADEREQMQAMRTKQLRMMKVE
jgi:uncharacterized protein with von Willebrand factor type A (vWA) domain